MPIIQKIEWGGFVSDYGNHGKEFFVSEIADNLSGNGADLKLRPAERL
jgi:hypothetical protein